MKDGLQRQKTLPGQINTLQNKPETSLKATASPLELPLTSRYVNEQKHGGAAFYWCIISGSVLLQTGAKRS